MKLYYYDSEQLQFKLFKRLIFFKKWMKIVFLTFFFLFMIDIFTFSTNTTDTYKYDNILLANEYNVFSEEKLIKEIKRLNFKFPHIVLAQAKLESGIYSSPIFLKNNNLFGMKEANIRTNLALGTKNNHAYYHSWYESLLDYALWYNAYAMKSETEEEFYFVLQSKYAENENYSALLRHIVKRDSHNVIF